MAQKILNTSDREINPATEEKQDSQITELQSIVSNTASIAMNIENALSATAYDLNSAAYSAATAITSDYILDSLEADFTTTESKTITITAPNGTKLFELTTTLQNVALNTEDLGQGFNSGDNVTVAVTQTAGACLMDLKLKIKKGNGVLAGSDTAVKFIDQDGVSQNIRMYNNRQEVAILTHGDMMSKGLIPNHKQEHVLGFNDSIASGVNTDISQLGVATIPLPSSAITMEIVSTSANDTSAGTGARTIEVHGLDSNYDQIEETITMNGTTPVTTVNQYIRVNYMHVITVGSNGVAVGDIKIRATGGGTEYLRITANGNVSLQSHYTVPNGKVAHLTAWSVGCSGKVPIRFFLRATSHNTTGILLPGVYHFKDISTLKESDAYRPFTQPFRLPAKCDIKVTAYGIGGVGEGSASIELYTETA